MLRSMMVVVLQPSTSSGFGRGTQHCCPLVVYVRGGGGGGGEPSRCACAALRARGPAAFRGRGALALAALLSAFHRATHGLRGAAGTRAGAAAHAGSFHGLTAAACRFDPAPPRQVNAAMSLCGGRPCVAAGTPPLQTAG